MAVTTAGCGAYGFTVETLYRYFSLAENVSSSVVSVTVAIYWHAQLLPTRYAQSFGVGLRVAHERVSDEMHACF